MNRVFLLGKVEQEPDEKGKFYLHVETFDVYRYQRFSEIDEHGDYHLAGYNPVGKERHFTVPIQLNTHDVSSYHFKPC